MTRSLAVPPPVPRRAPLHVQKQRNLPELTVTLVNYRKKQLTNMFPELFAFAS